MTANQRLIRDETAVIGNANPLPTWRQAEVVHVTEVGHFAHGFTTIRPNIDPVRLAADMANAEGCGVQLRITEL